MSRIITDISHWQGKVDFEKMKSAGASAVIFKASQFYEDSKYKENVAGVKGILPYAAYHYYDNDIDPNVQAHKFASVLDGTEKFIIADYEDRSTGNHSGWKKLYTFLVKLQDLVPDKKIVIYSTYYYWKENSPQGFWQKSSLDWFGQFKFWYAAYNTRPWEEQLIPKPWTPEETLMWQYTDKGDGPMYGVSSMNIDLNEWTGTEEEFIEYFGIGEVGPPIDPPPTGDEMLELLERIAVAAERTADAVEDGAVTPPDDQTSEYPKHWELINEKDNGTIPFFRNPDVNTNKIQIWKDNIVAEFAPPNRFYESPADLKNLKKDWAWIPDCVVQNANGYSRDMPQDFITTTGKPTDNFYGGAFVERKHLQIV